MQELFLFLKQVSVIFELEIEISGSIHTLI